MWFIQLSVDLELKMKALNIAKENKARLLIHPDFYFPVFCSCAMLHNKSSKVCTVPHLLGLCSGCVRLFPPAPQLSSVFLYCFPVTAVITYDPWQITAVFLCPSHLLLLAICFQMCFILSSSLKWMVLFFPFSVSGFFTLTISESSTQSAPHLFL